jgi:hypothetical protein
MGLLRVLTQDSHASISADRPELVYERTLFFLGRAGNLKFCDDC